MEQKHALLRADHTVGNVIVTDDTTPEGWLETYVEEHPEYVRSIDVEDDAAVSIGWTWNGDEFQPPAEEATDTET